MAEDSLHGTDELCSFCKQQRSDDGAAVTINMYTRDQTTRLRVARCKSCSMRHQLQSVQGTVLLLATPFIIAAAIIWTNAATTLGIIALLIAVYVWYMVNYNRKGTGSARRTEAAQRLIHEGWRAGPAWSARRGTPAPPP